MNKPTAADLQSLAAEVILPFYCIQREVPLHLRGLSYENDAEHSWSLALLACALAPHVDTGLDIGKVAQYATVHDLTELYAGDTSNFAADHKKASKEKREAKALHRLRSELTAFPWIIDTLVSYEAQDTNEALFVRSVDKIIPLLLDILDQGWLYHEKKMTFEEWEQHMRIPREKAAHHSGAFVYYQLIWDALTVHPEYFYKDMGPTK